MMYISVFTHDLHSSYFVLASTNAAEREGLTYISLNYVWINLCTAPALDSDLHSELTDAISFLNKSYTVLRGANSEHGRAFKIML